MGRKDSVSFNSESILNIFFFFLRKCWLFMSCLTFHDVESSLRFHKYLHVVTSHDLLVSLFFHCWLHINWWFLVNIQVVYIYIHVSYFEMKTILTWHILATRNLIIFLFFTFLLQYNPIHPIQPNDPKYTPDPLLGDRVHCVVYVINCCQISVLTEEMLNKYKNLRRRISNNGRKIVFKQNTFEKYRIENMLKIFLDW